MICCAALGGEDMSRCTPGWPMCSRCDSTPCNPCSTAVAQHVQSRGQASSCHSEPKGWGPLRLYYITLCIVLCTSFDSDSTRTALPISLHVQSLSEVNYITKTPFLSHPSPSHLPHAEVKSE
jgi:hypothetical protein